MTWCVRKPVRFLKERQLRLHLNPCQTQLEPTRIDGGELAGVLSKNGMVRTKTCPLF
jgi:hypothetical protein